MRAPAAAIACLIAAAGALSAGDAPAPAPVKAPSGPVVVTPSPKPFLGVNIDENSANFEPAQGLPITVVIPSSTAATLGLVVGDHLLAFNGQPLHSQADLLHALSLVKVGDPITVMYTHKTGDKTEPKSVNGLIQERPQVKTITSDIRSLSDKVNGLRALVDANKKKEISLVEVLQQLKELEQNLPAAVADFKKQYPKGEFNIAIKIDITSDTSASQVIEVGNQPGAAIKTGAGAPGAPSPKAEDAGTKTDGAPAPAGAQPAKP
jgi:membrane-associated protease RseP (regulator of RpoE activity)